MNGRNRRASRHPFEKQSSCIKSTSADAPLRAERSSGDNTLQKQQIKPSGTSHASNYIILSVVPSLRCRWGGRRNSAARTSNSLSLGQATNIIGAARYAASIGLPLNRHLTIHWEQAGIADERAAWATGRFLKLAGDWIRTRGGRFAWVWVRENGKGKGSHVHVLLHIPAGMSLGTMQRRWIRVISGRPYRAAIIKTERIGRTAGAAQTAPDFYRANLDTVVGYILKGACRAAAKELRLRRLECGGRIIGKRAATSQNIGRTARSQPGREIAFR